VIQQKPQLRGGGRGRGEEKNMNKIVPTAMDLNDYLLSFLTKRISWVILLG